MALYTISDLHLSTLDSTNKSMEIFGGKWKDYIIRIKNNWERLVEENDTVVIPGDISWALSLTEAVSDLKFIDSLPGKKILGKGNHDFWWSTMRKHYDMFEKEGISSIQFLFNNAYETDDYIIAGTRGWYQEELAKNAPENADFDKLINRESLRLKTSLGEAKRLQESSPSKPIVVFMHFPPYWNEKESKPLIDILLENEIKQVYFGHIHGNYSVERNFKYKGIQMHLISADFTDFTPQIVKF